MIIRTIVLMLLCGTLLGALGCSRGGMAAGGFSAFFDDPADAQKVVLGAAKPVDYKGNHLVITPRHRLGDRDHVVAFSVDLKFGGTWDLREDDEFRSLLRKHLQPSPSEIYAIRLHGLKYSPRKFERKESIQEVWEYLWDRPQAGYSMEEVRQLLPEDLAGRLEESVADGRSFVFEWPHDARSLVLAFAYDKDKMATLLRSYELGHPQQEKGAARRKL